MTKKLTIGNQDAYVLPKPTGTVVWIGDHRIELDRAELTALASALADAAAPQLAVA